MNTVPNLDKATALVPGITNRYCIPSFETATEPVIGRAFARPVRVGKAKRAHHSRSRSHQWWARRKGRLCPPTIRSHALRMRSNSLKHNNLMPV